jgi:topoisomerase-4 subunit A
LSYKQGDGFLTVARGRSNQQVVLLDSTGRTYSLPANGLPSARGQGEPLTGKLAPPAGAQFQYALMGKDSEQYLLYSAEGYGFLCAFADMQSRVKAGKVTLTVSDGVGILPPLLAADVEHDSLALVSSAGYLLVIGLQDLPQLSKGKGNKLISLKKGGLGIADEVLQFAVILPAGGQLLVQAGKQFKAIKGAELDKYRSERGKRGILLPKGYQNVTGLEISSN